MEYPRLPDFECRDVRDLEGGMSMVWHCTPAEGSLLLWNARCGQGGVSTVSAMGIEGALAPHDVNPMLGPLEKVLEEVRAAQFRDKPPRKGALYAFEDEATCRKYAAKWFGHRRTEIVRLEILSGSIVHRGHLGWLSNPRKEEWPEVARSYWAGEEADPPHDWEYVIFGSVFCPDWNGPPFGRPPFAKVTGSNP